MILDIDISYRRAYLRHGHILDTDIIIYNSRNRWHILDKPLLRDAHNLDTPFTRDVHILDTGIILNKAFPIHGQNLEILVNISGWEIVYKIMYM